MDIYSESLENTALDPLLKLSKLNLTSAFSPPEQEEKVNIIVYEKGLLSLVQTSPSKKAKIFAKDFQAFTPADLEQLKIWEIFEICVYTNFFGQIITFRSGQYEPLKKFLAVETSEAGIILTIIIALFLLIFVFYPELR